MESATASSVLRSRSLRNSPPICFVISIILIIRGLIRFGQANSRAHNGKGAITDITGACLLNSRLIMSVFVKTIEAAGMKIPGISS